LKEYNFRYSNIVDIPRARTSTYGKNSFKYAAAVLWNDLPDDFRKISNFIAKMPCQRTKIKIRQNESMKNAEITCDEVVKLLGIDYQLNFNYHIKNICRKASQQLNVLKRIGCFLSKFNSSYVLS
jgi:hypothetical protein